MPPIADYVGETQSALNDLVTARFVRIVLPSLIFTLKAIIDPLCSFYTQIFTWE